MSAEERREWHLEKSVSISHLLTTIVMVAAVLGAWVSMSERVSILETQYLNISQRLVSILERQSSTDERQDASIQQFRTEIREDVRGIHLKLDRIAEQTK